MDLKWWQWVLVIIGMAAWCVLMLFVGALAVQMALEVWD